MSVSVSTALPAPSAVAVKTNVPRRISRFALEQRSRLFDDDHDGVRRLMWAILKDTLRCYQNHFEGHSVQSQRLYREAWRWIQSDDVTWVFSFENVCAVLGVDAERLRTELARWARGRRHSLVAAAGAERC